MASRACFIIKHFQVKSLEQLGIRKYERRQKKSPGKGKFPMKNYWLLLFRCVSLRFLWPKHTLLKSHVEIRERRLGVCCSWNLIEDSRTLNTCMGLFPNKTFFIRHGMFLHYWSLLVVSLTSNQTKTKTFSGKLLFNAVLCGRDTELNVSVPFCLGEACC